MININKFEKMTGIALKNCLRLHFDSITLFNNLSYPSSYFLSVLAVEEYGKAINILDLIYFYITDSLSEKEGEKLFESTLFHTYKQRKYAFHHRDILPKEYLKKVSSGYLEIEKQNAIYVGLPKRKKKIDFDGKIINPLRMGKTKAKQQITYFNDCLLRLVLGNIKGVYIFESNSFSKQLNRDLYFSLLTKWEYVSAATQKEIRRLEKFDDE
jgi:AbiV family abortive infection protein